ncbi:hypothetical protein K435DRAFT_754226 [Dendrothele bispora CBS 962.96]|uniref:DUF6534 domain-containing protein n=1 Tax=Dendrothele bispora (strain CBS 962.96) TaxID=1314807 RepID=A0A4S8M5X3_DENBC|nr:hypothetical protein K435DRAFT_754226 [Dendrothele bispora CBS 962.96]
MHLFGILCCQVYMYHLSFPDDAKHIKALVYGIFTVDLAATVMAMADMYHWFAAGFGNLLFVDDVYLSAFDTPMLGAVLAAIAQGFYCYRLLKLKKNTWPICVLVILIALAGVTAGVYGAIVGHQEKTFSRAAKKTLPAIYVIYVGSAAADVLIAVTMTALLLHSRQKTHKQSHYMIKRIINLTVETNLLSSFLALLTVILLVAIPNTNYFTCPSMILGKIYSNSLLLMLNNRAYLSAGALTIPSASNPSSSGSTSRGTSTFKMSWHAPSKSFGNTTTATSQTYSLRDMDPKYGVSKPIAM